MKINNNLLGKHRNERKYMFAHKFEDFFVVFWDLLCFLDVAIQKST